MGISSLEIEQDDTATDTKNWMNLWHQKPLNTADFPFLIVGKFSFLASVLHHKYQQYVKSVIKEKVYVCVSYMIQYCQVLHPHYRLIFFFFHNLLFFF